MKIRKIFLMFAVISAFAFLFAFPSFASENDFILSKDTTEFNVVDFQFDHIIYEDENFIFINGAGFTGFQPRVFKKYVNTFGCDSYSSWMEFCRSASSEKVNDLYLALWLLDDYGCDEVYFNKLYNYTEITQADLDAKDAVIAENAQTIDKLEENLAYTRNQVTTLSQSRGELLAVNASLEKQLQNKINLAYAQGLVDSGSTSDVVPVLIGVITLLEGVALVILIVSKIKNRKKGR